MNKLRPIGTEFEITYPPIKTSTFNKDSIIKYRIIAHERRMRFTNDKEGEMVEVIEALEAK